MLIILTTSSAPLNIKTSVCKWQQDIIRKLVQAKCVYYLGDIADFECKLIHGESYFQT